MKEVGTRKFKRKITLLFLVVICLGALISFIVFYLGSAVKDQTAELVKQDLPNYSAFLELRNHLSEQERALYEYYASFNQSLYTEDFLAAHQSTDDIVVFLNAQFSDVLPLQNIEQNQQQVKQLAQQLHENMLKQPANGTDWDLARYQLSQISSTMRATMFDIVALTQISETEINKSQQQISNLLFTVNGFVIAYGILSLIVAYVSARGLLSYLTTDSQKQRLELIPKRTPNPIIGIDEFNRVTFINPATKRLLASMERGPEHADILVPEDLTHYQHRILNADKRFDTFEISVAGKDFVCELHWLPKQSQWDLHLTDVSAQKYAEEKLAFQAFHHPETGLANQYKLNEDLDGLCGGESPFVLGFVEVRSFRYLISSHGNEVASQAVNAIAAVLHNCCHEISAELSLYHISDKNFAVIDRSGVSRPDIDKMVAYVRGQVRLTESIKSLQIELDFGFTEFPYHADTREILIRNARIALDASARDSDVSLKFFDDQMHEAIVQRQKLLHAIRNAMQEKAFMLYYQPQYSFASGKIVGAEALIRWWQDDKLVPPSAFIPVAEKDGLIHALGRWTIRDACRHARCLMDEGFTDFSVAVNISPIQFAMDDFVDIVRESLSETGLPVEYLELEITESSLFTNEPRTISSLHALRSMGVQLAIDDFGTGYSSLSYLQHLPVNKLKIDQSFIIDLVNNEANQAIVQSVIDLGKNLHLTVVAEGVESQQDMQLLADMQCDIIQGDFLSPALDEKALLTFISISQRQSESFLGDYAANQK